MNRRLSIAVASLAFAITASAQEAPPRITYSTVAVPVGRALDEISKLSGVHLETLPMMRSEVLILHLKDCSFEDVKARIATALAAKWETIDGGLRLVPDVPARRLEEQREQAEYTAAIAKNLKQLVDSLTPPKVDPKAKPESANAAQARQIAAQFGMGAAGNASGKAVIRLAQGIGATSLALIDEKSRVVYSSNANRMQRPMPANANAVLAQLVQEYNVEVQQRLKAKRDNPIPVEQDERMQKLMEFFGNFEDDDKPIAGVPTKALLVCSRQPLFGGLSLTLKVYNDRGQVIITGTQTLSAGQGMMETLNMEFDEQGNPKPKKPVPTPAGEKAIEFSETTKEMQGATNFMNMSQGGKAMSAELRAKLLNPEMYDPLSFTHSEALIDTAKQRGLQLVAVMPDAMDSIFSMSLGSPDAKSTPTSYLASIKQQASVVVDGKWMVVRPVKPADARKRRIDRVALGNFIRSVDRKGSFSLDDLASYAQHSNSPMEDSGSLLYIMLFAPNAMQSGMSGSVSWDMLRFYGSLSPTQKKNLSEGGRLPFQQINPTQMAAVRQMAFGPDQTLHAEDPNAKKPDYEMPAMWRQLFQRAAGGDYRTEPTEVMPNGIPPQGYVELNLTTDVIAKPAGNVPAMFGSAILGADELAMLKMFRESESMAQFAAMMPQIEELKLGSRSVYEFKFTVAQGVTMTHVLNDDKMDPNAKAVKVANLPAEFTKKIEERMAMLKKIPFFDPMFLGGQRAVPPPSH